MGGVRGRDTVGWGQERVCGPPAYHSALHHSTTPPLTKQRMTMTPTSTDVKRKTQDSNTAAGPLPADELRKMDAYWRASHYLSVGQIYLLGKSPLPQPPKREHNKPRLLGHLGPRTGPQRLHVQLNRGITRVEC